MRRVLGAVAVLVVVVVGLLVGSRSVGPGTQPAPASRLYVAISRSDDESVAREIEVIDTASGERSLIDIGARISALTLSPDRKTLFVGLDDGLLLLVDPVSGVRYGEIRSRRASWILPLGTTEVLLVGSSPTGGAIAKVDVPGRREIAVAELDVLPGQPVVRAGELLVPVVARNDARTAQLAPNSLAVYSTATLSRSANSLVAQMTGRLALGHPIAHQTASRGVAYLAQWDSGPGAARLLIGVAGEMKPREVLVAVTTPGTERPLRGLATVQSSLASTPDGVLHVCTGSAELAARYIVTETARLVGSECGQLLGVAERVYLAVRGKPRVAVIDAASGRALRDLLLPGIPVLIAGSP